MASREDEVDDVLQDTMLELYRNIDSFRGESSFLTWAASVARSQANRHRRKRRRFDNRDGAILAVTTSLPDYFSSGTRDPEAAAVGEQSHRQLRQALECLAPMDRAVLILRDVQGFTTGETAAHLDMTNAAVKSRLHRARGSLRRILVRRQTQMPLLNHDLAGLKAQATDELRARR